MFWRKSIPIYKKSLKKQATIYYERGFISFSLCMIIIIYLWLINIKVLKNWHPSPLYCHSIHLIWYHAMFFSSCGAIEVPSKFTKLSSLFSSYSSYAMVIKIYNKLSARCLWSFGRSYHVSRSSLLLFDMASY